MGYEWARLIWWLSQGQNAAAIQTVIAGVDLVSTLVLLLVTMRYVTLTKTLAVVAKEQLQTIFQPSLRIRATKLEYYSDVNIEIENLTVYPVYLERVNVLINF
jgi:hypothetical protein